MRSILPILYGFLGLVFTVRFFIFGDVVNLICAVILLVFMLLWAEV